MGQQVDQAAQVDLEGVSAFGVGHLTESFGERARAVRARRGCGRKEYGGRGTTDTGDTVDTRGAPKAWRGERGPCGYERGPGGPDVSGPLWAWDLTLRDRHDYDRPTAPEDASCGPGLRGPADRRDGDGPLRPGRSRCSGSAPG
ncbi:hypothetical protein GCM10027072_63100 [Streptomyces bullii]